MKPSLHDHLHPVDPNAARSAYLRRLTHLRDAREDDASVRVTYFTQRGNKVAHATGKVGYVAASGAYVVVNGLHVPAHLIVKVRTLNTNQRPTGA